ncbi:MAG: beta-lactamase family protein [Gemmatimonadales bacterium]|nr:beta-lactamase family protein [Gemmatimonadales bacterium]
MRDRVYPGAVLVIGRRDTILLARGVGHLTWDPASAAPSPDLTRWDLASLTKVVATTGVAARLAERGLLDLDAPVGRYLECWRGGGRDAVTVRQLLTHRSGLRPWLPLWRDTPTADSAWARTCAETPRVTPGDSTIYSDLNFIVLGRVLEAVGATSLDSLVAREVARPLSLVATSFDGRTLAPRNVAPTSRDAGRTMLGEVHDQNAERLGGVAGHAGLFGTGLDLARVAQAWLGRSPDAGPWIDRETRHRFTAIPSTGRPLGWDRPEHASREPSQFGRHTSATTFGHTGWTGTQLWLDPERDLFVVLLTNRAYAPAYGDTHRRMREVRARVAEEVRTET